MERDVPGFEPGAGEGFELGELTLRGGPAQAREAPQELEHLAGIARHLGGERILGEAAESGELGCLMAQRENFLDQRRVVPVRIALLGRARDPGRVEILAQLAMLGMREHGLVIRRIEREQPAGTLVPGGFSARACDHGIRQSGEFGFIVDATRPGIGRVQHVLVELRLRRRQPLHQFAKALLVLGLERHTRQPEVTQRVVHQLALVGIQRCRTACP